MFLNMQKTKRRSWKTCPSGFNFFIHDLIILPALTFLVGGVTLNFQYPELKSTIRYNLQF